MKQLQLVFSREELARRRGRLLARIHGRYETVDELFAIGPVQVHFTRVKDADRVLDMVCEEQDTREQQTHQRRGGDDLHLPYWAELWDSSIGVAHWLVHSNLRETNVLDLGCGMGFVGTVAAALGNRVLLADLEADALLFAQLNTLPYSRPILVRRPDVRKRYFGMSRYYRRVRTRSLNWQTDRLDERFGSILGADVLYERAQWEYLEPFWRAHLNDGGLVVLGEPGRMTGDLFGEWITARGWTLAQIEQKIPARTRPIRLFILNR